MKEIFSYNADVNKNAYLNWRTDRHDAIYNMITIADGFMKSSLIACRKAIDDNRDKHADITIFPILFNANHGIELYLKAIMWCLHILLDQDKKIEGSHNIKQIYRTVYARMRDFEKDKHKREKFEDLTNNLDSYINELFVLLEDGEEESDKDRMDFSRYPFNKKYVNHFYVDKLHNVVVDLENFERRFTEIHESLDRIATHYLYDYIYCDSE